MGTNQDNKKSWWRGRFWLFGVVLSLLLGGAAASYLMITSLRPDLISLPDRWIVILPLSVGAYFGLCASRGVRIWSKFTQHERKLVERRDSANPFAELFAYLVLAQALLASIGLGNTDSLGFWPWQVSLESPQQLAVFLGFLFGSFLPLVAGFVVHTSYTLKDRDQSNHVSNESFALAIGLIAMVGGLAWAAGEGKIQMDGIFGPFIMLLVLTLFLLFIAIPYFHSFLLGRRQYEDLNSIRQQAARQGFASLNPSFVASRLDALLVRYVAPLTGATQSSEFVVLPHLCLVAIFVPLTIMGYALPAPWGLAPISFAFLLAVSLGRRWAWVEGDRETAMRLRSTKHDMIQIGFRNDLRDEALLGYLFLFILVPLALRQMQLWVSPFGEAASSATILDWAGFFGTELAKAVPIVDWADIYGIQANLPDFQTDTAFPRHLVFGARLMVDLVVIAALLQAFSIMQRNSSQMQLFRDGQLDLLDPFTEESQINRGVRIVGDATRFTPEQLNGSNDLVSHNDKVFKIGADLKKLFADHAARSVALRRPKRPYNINRLSELAADDGWTEAQALVKYLKKHYPIQVGTASNQLIDLSRSWAESPLIGNRNIDEFDAESGLYLRQQRTLLEELVETLIHEKQQIGPETLEAVALILDAIRNKSEMFNAKAALFELLSRQPAQESAWLLAATVLRPERLSEVSEAVPVRPIDIGNSIVRQSVDDVRSRATYSLAEYLNSDVKFGSLPQSNAGKKFALAAMKAIAGGGDTERPAQVARDSLAAMIVDNHDP